MVLLFFHSHKSFADVFFSFSPYFSIKLYLWNFIRNKIKIKINGRCFFFSVFRCTFAIFWLISLYFSVFFHYFPTIFSIFVNTQLFLCLFSWILLQLLLFGGQPSTSFRDSANNSNGSLLYSPILLLQFSFDIKKYLKNAEINSLDSQLKKLMIHLAVDVGLFVVRLMARICFGDFLLIFNYVYFHYFPL